MSSFHYVERYLSGYTYILLGLILITVLVRALSRVRPEYDPREPPLVAPRIPVIGHNVAILRDGPGAWLKIQYVAKDPTSFHSIDSSLLFPTSDTLPISTARNVPSPSRPCLASAAQADYTW